MPHFIIEYAQSLEPCAPALLSAVHKAACHSDLFQPDDIKVRAHAFNHYLNGCEPKDFIHLVIKLMPGRTQQQRQALSQAALTALSNSLCAVALTKPVVISSEVIELDRSCYQKTIKE